jgi:hypothetical protein
VTYDEKVTQLVQIVQPFEEVGSYVDHALQAKLASAVQEGDQERVEFWTDIRGEFLSKSHYMRFEELRHLERRFTQNDQEFLSLQNASSAKHIYYKWLLIIPALEDYAYDMLEYYMELESNFVSIDKERRKCIRDGIKFFVDAVDAGKLDDEMFAYLPLMRWAIENLLIYNKFDIAMLSPLLTTYYMPLVKKHITAAMGLKHLIDTEAVELAKERGEEVLAASEIMSPYKGKHLTDQLETGEWMEAGEKDIPVFYTQLVDFMSGVTRRPPDLEQAEEFRRNYPYLSLYRSMFTAELLGVYTDCVYIVSKPLAFKIFDELEVKTQLYSQKNMIKQMLTNVDIVFHATESHESYRSKIHWQTVLANTKEAIGFLLEAEVLTKESVEELHGVLRYQDNIMRGLVR